MGAVNGSPYFLIGLAVLLMAAAVVVVGEGLVVDQAPARVPPGMTEPTPALPSEAGMYARAARAADYASMPQGRNTKRTRAVYYARRAYPGAPPLIAHPVDEREAGGKTCLACHGDGGWVPRFEAYAPVTPHPELIACRQCHVPGAAQPSPLAAGGAAPVRGSVSGWQSLAPPALHGAALLGSPPPIPHGLQMRANCRACHAGPGAVDEFRTSHPERVSCRQCHALRAAEVEPFERAPREAGR